MNRFIKYSAAAALALLVVAAVPAHAGIFHKKKKKDFNLSTNPLADVKSEQPDKVLFDKAMLAMKRNRYEVARLDLQTLLNTYPESEYRMRAKLAVGDSWYKEGGTAALTQAEAEYEDFITFFPDAPEAAEAKMKVADIYYQQMEKPDRDYTDAEEAEQQYLQMINMFPDSPLIPIAKQKLRDVQEVLAQREADIGFYYEGQGDYSAAIARLQTVADTYPLYSQSDQVWIGIGDSYETEAKFYERQLRVPAAVRERLYTVYMDKAAKCYDKVVTRYPMSPHVEDAQDRLVAMNRPLPKPTQAAIAESDAEERSRQPLHFTDRTLGLIKRGPTVVEAVHVGEPTLTDPQRIIAPEVNKENVALFREAMNAYYKPAPRAAAPVTPIPANQPPRTGEPSQAPLQLEPPSGGGGNGVGVTIVSAPSGPQTTDPNAVVKPVGPTSTVLPPVQKPTEAPIQINDIKPGEVPQQPATTQAQPKKSKTDLSEESSSRKKKKKGLDKLNPF
jgi:outer membrane protein assembly factor BamD